MYLLDVPVGNDYIYYEIKDYENRLRRMIGMYKKWDAHAELFPSILATKWLGHNTNYIRLKKKGRHRIYA